MGDLPRLSVSLSLSIFLSHSLTVDLSLSLSVYLSLSLASSLSVSPLLGTCSCASLPPSIFRVSLL
jgi:hypothetical protein